MKKNLFIIRLAIKVVLFIIFSTPLFAADDNEMVISNTGQSFGSYIERLTTTIENSGMSVSTGECECGIKTVTAKDFTGDDGVILTLNKPGLMLRMLQAGASAGATPPLRFYISRIEGGEARVAYHLPSLALGAYGQPNLNEISKELDILFTDLIHQSMIPQ